MAVWPQPKDATCMGVEQRGKRLLLSVVSSLRSPSEFITERTKCTVPVFIRIYPSEIYMISQSGLTIDTTFICLRQ